MKIAYQGWYMSTRKRKEKKKTGFEIASRGTSGGQSWRSRNGEGGPG